MKRLLRSSVSLSCLVSIAVLASACLGLPKKPDIPDGIPPGRGAPPPYIDVNAQGRTAQLLRGWATPIADKTGIPLVATEAYGNAAEIQRQQHPECGIAWTTLAGVAGVESKHGTHHGTNLLADGSTDPPIRGVPLDGSGGNMQIPDTDHGKLDGDPVHDRAMGPFQFIPETWQRFGVDASGDGRADPDNIDDAALTAARYLCVSAGGDMTTAEGWEKAIKVYNNSMSYVLDVRDHANAYSVNVSY